MERPKRCNAKSLSEAGIWDCKVDVLLCMRFVSSSQGWSSRSEKRIFFEPTGTDGTLVLSVG